MRTIEIDSKACNSSELAYTLREIANMIDEGYRSGVTWDDTTWRVDGEDEED